ncbi:MAG: arginine--tRNA ligase [Flexistipes sinusarabici]|uniref:Arginine--tRNA ligase n=1 Tax=Flexistipes sinusarabici TaxID=2352 RepID=A0A5D0MMD0_FLESI|nr:arginine--tRNA ligase [Flexistipes sinusarabici]TYB33562.1 MAG: arginine--tRNA ligase [Flexistipes sinusarabici]
MKEVVRKKISEAVGKIYDGAIDSLNYTVEIPKKSENGDFATNVAFLLAKELRKAPAKIAEDILRNLDESFFHKVEIAGGGFINFFISYKQFHKFLLDILENEENLTEKTKNPLKIQVEFVSANPTGPLHVGHGRGASYGDSLARILSAAGHEVCREYYVNDAGNQMNNLAKSIYARYSDLTGGDYPFPGDGYRGEYIIAIAEKLKSEFGDSLLSKDEDDALSVCLDRGKSFILNEIKDDLRDFNVEFDKWFSEQSLYDEGKVEDTLNFLNENNKIYEADSALWFKSAEYNDDKDRVLRKSDGELTYFASDIAYHRDKFERGFDKVIDVWGADHHGYVDRMKAAVNALGRDENDLYVALVQMVSLIKDGNKISMSTRAGQFVTLKWLVDEVGASAARFFYLMRDINSQFEFDIDLAKSKTSDNPVYYVQYGHARVCSLFAKLKEKGISASVGENVERLEKKDEIEIIKKMYDFRNVLNQAASNYQPHRIVYYLQELAGLLHSYYYTTPIIVEDDKELTNARITLCKGVAIVIRYALNLLGIKAVERM